MTSKRELCGYEVDDAARTVIRREGFAEYFFHRTGHSIGTEVHANGVNIDNLETRDERRLVSHSAFSIEPASLGPVDWLFSDVICYPTRLLSLVERWLAAGLARNLVCTIKFQGATDHDAARRFAAIPNSRLIHLHHNKHELTWIRLG